MVSVKFILRQTSRKIDAPASLYVRVHAGRGHLAIINTGLRLRPSVWNEKTEKLKKGHSPAEEIQHNHLNNRLDDIRNNLVALCVNYVESNRKVLDDDIRVVIKLALCDELPTQSGIKVNFPQQQSVGGYTDFLIREMAAGRFTFAGEDYRKNTVTMWRVFSRILHTFEIFHLQCTGNILTWDSIGKQTFDLFVKYMRMHGYMMSTQNKMIVCFKAIINYAYKYHHLHDNTRAVAQFHLLRVHENDAQARIYLNEEEVQALYDMKLPEDSLKDKVRDVFLVGVYTGQRFSDYGRLSPEHFTTTEKGTRVVKLVQKKTRHTVIVPYLNENLETIARKYNYCLPNIDNVVLNRYIKDICKQLSQKVPSLAKLVPTTLTLREKTIENNYREKHHGHDYYQRDEYGRVVKPRYEMVMSHTARRTAITNLFKSHKFSTFQLMSVSGHRSERSLLLYIRESAAELADEIDSILRGFSAPPTNSF